MALTLRRDPQQAGSSDRGQPIRLLLACDDAAEAESYVHEFQRAHFNVLTRVTRDTHDFAAQLRLSHLTLSSRLTRCANDRAAALAPRGNTARPAPSFVSSDPDEDMVGEASGAAGCVANTNLRRRRSCSW